MGLPDLQDVDPELMKGLQKLLAYDEAAPENGGASVADVFCLTFEVDWVAFDEVRRHELRPGGRDVEVTAANREEYVGCYVEWVLAGSVRAQFEEFKVRGLFEGGLCGFGMAPHPHDHQHNRPASTA